MREALELFKKHGTTVYMELKGPGTEEPTLALVDELDMVDQVVFVSFEEERLEKIHQLRPERNDDGHYKYKVALLFLRVPEDFIDFIEPAQRIGASEVHIRYDAVAFSRVQAIHDAGMQSLAWCGGPKVVRKDGTLKYLDCDNEDESMYQCILNTGVQAVCVNRPDLLLKMVENYPPPNPVAECLVEVGAVDVVDDDPNSTNMKGKKKTKELVEEVLEEVNVDVAVTPYSRLEIRLRISQVRDEVPRSSTKSSQIT